MFHVLRYSSLLCSCWNSGHLRGWRLCSGRWVPAWRQAGRQALQVARQHGKHALQPDAHASDSSEVRPCAKDCCARNLISEVLLCSDGQGDVKSIVSLLLLLPLLWAK